MKGEDLYCQDWIDLGKGNKINQSAIILWDYVELGYNNIIYPNTVIGLPGFIRDLDKDYGKIIIGDNNRIGCSVSIMSGNEGEITRIGNDNLIMNYVNIGHSAIVGNNNEIGAKTLIPGWFELGNDNKIKLGCTFRNRRKLGNNNTVGMGSVVIDSFDDNNTIIGVPAKLVM